MVSWTAGNIFAIWGAVGAAFVIGVFIIVTIINLQRGKKGKAGFATILDNPLVLKGVIILACVGFIILASLKVFYPEAFESVKYTQDKYIDELEKTETCLYNPDVYSLSNAS